MTTGVGRGSRPWHVNCLHSKELQSSGGDLLQLATDIERPNGVQLSPDEKILCIANTNGEYILAFDVKPDSSG